MFGKRCALPPRRLFSDDSEKSNDGPSNGPIDNSNREATFEYSVFGNREGCTYLQTSVVTRRGSLERHGSRQTSTVSGTRLRNDPATKTNSDCPSSSCKLETSKTCDDRRKFCPNVLANMVWRTHRIAGASDDSDFEPTLKKTGMPSPPRVIVNEKDWMEDVDDYHPADYTSQTVLDAAGADDVTPPQSIVDRPYLWSGIERPAKYCCDFDESRRPLHPHGRQGIAGRGVLLLWGENRAVTALLVRRAYDDWEVLTRWDESEKAWEPPSLMPAEFDTTIFDMLSRLNCPNADAIAKGFEKVFSGILPYSRETDNAWLAGTAHFKVLEDDEATLVTEGQWGTWKRINDLPDTTPFIAFLRKKTSDLVVALDRQTWWSACEKFACTAAGIAVGIAVASRLTRST